MNREIKFRAWYPKDKKMTFSDQTNWGAFGDCEMSDAQSGSCHLMQFTGRKDINGKEIYEGDIVRGFLRNGLGDVVLNVNVPVIFKNGCFLPHISWLGPGTEIEVIGNIYENPELLKEKEVSK